MRRLWLILFATACAAAAWKEMAAGPAQSSEGRTPYQPAVPSPTTNVYGGGGWGGTGGASTAAGSAMNGMASVISAQGDYNLSTSAAAVNMTQAQKNEIENRQLYTNTYFEMRSTNKASSEAEAGPKPTMEQMARYARDGLPKPLPTSQFDQVTGRLQWPSALQQPSFASQRDEVDQMFAKFATYGGLPYADQTKVRQTIDGMYGQLKAQLKQIPPQDYVVCRSFLNSVLCTTTKTQL
jgi:hypothetical protein